MCHRIAGTLTITLLYGENMPVTEWYCQVAKFDNEDDGELTFNEFVLCARYLEEPEPEPQL